MNANIRSSQISHGWDKERRCILENDEKAFDYLIMYFYLAFNITDMKTSKAACEIAAKTKWKLPLQCQCQPRIFTHNTPTQWLYILFDN